MSRNVVGWFEIAVADMERAKRFYEAVFQVKMEHLATNNDASMPAYEMWGFPWVDDAGGAGGALVKMDDAKPSVGGTTVYFSCDDCAVEESRIAANGGVVLMTKLSIDPHGFVSLVQDTEGNNIGLHSMK